MFPIMRGILRKPLIYILQLIQPTPVPYNMALPLPSGLTPSEVSFLCEMELVTVVPRQRLESIDLLTVSASQDRVHKPRR